METSTRESSSSEKRARKIVSQSSRRAADLCERPLAGGVVAHPGENRGQVGRGEKGLRRKSLRPAGASRAAAWDSSHAIAGSSSAAAVRACDARDSAKKRRELARALRVLPRQLQLVVRVRRRELPAHRFVGLARARAPGDLRALRRAAHQKLGVAPRGRPERGPSSRPERFPRSDRGPPRPSTAVRSSRGAGGPSRPAPSRRPRPARPGSSTLRRRKCPGGTGSRFFSAETSDSGTFAPATSSRMTSSAGFISTIRPAPRPAR